MYRMIPLGYEYNGLEPYIDAETVYIHYNNHHKKYLTKLNELLEKNNYNFVYSLEELVNHIDEFPLSDRDDILFNLGGVLNHNLYWQNMSPNDNNIPVGLLSSKINAQFGSFDNFKEKFIDKASNLVGSGYTFLIVDGNKNLNIINTSNQETPYYYGFTPIMTLDLWEHAYYLKYTYLKNEYIENFFKLVDFEIINKMYEEQIN